MKKLLLVVLGLSIFSLQATWTAMSEMDCKETCGPAGYCYQGGLCNCKQEDGSCEDYKLMPTFL